MKESVLIDHVFINPSGISTNPASFNRIAFFVGVDKQKDPSLYVFGSHKEIVDSYLRTIVDVKEFLDCHGYFEVEFDLYNEHIRSALSTKKYEGTFFRFFSGNLWHDTTKQVYVIPLYRQVREGTLYAANKEEYVKRFPALFTEEKDYMKAVIVFVKEIFMGMLSDKGLHKKDLKEHWTFKVIICTDKQM